MKHLRIGFSATLDHYVNDSMRVFRVLRILNYSLEFLTLSSPIPHILDHRGKNRGVSQDAGQRYRSQDFMDLMRFQELLDQTHGVSYKQFQYECISLVDFKVQTISCVFCYTFANCPQVKIISFSDFEDLGLGFGKKIIRNIGFLKESSSNIKSSHGCLHSRTFQI